MMTDSKWVMNRAGLLNFWYYDDEIFHFSHGKLLLRGTNGSGKSVTMQSFLPVLLDGKKSPDRLDPFGSKARRMEDYLLGEKEVVDRDERTGYLFIEYKKRGTEQYITTGIGMQAKRHKGIKSWYFLLTDNRRIGHDFQLAQHLKGDRVPLSAKELENRIGQGGYVVHTQREYMELVNKHIFGFQSNEAYEDLIKLLIQLRSPKLSKDFKPTVIYEILESALPPLTDDELRHLSDTIENMDQTQQQLEQLEREYESSRKLVNQYHLYNQFILAERAGQWKAAEKRYKEAENKVNMLMGQSEELEGQIKQLEADRENYQTQKNVAETEKERLQNHEVWKLEKEKTDKKTSIQMLEKEIDELQTKWDKKKEHYNRDWQEREKTESELIQYEKNVEDLLGDLQLDAEESAFAQHILNLNDFNRHKEANFDFDVWMKEAENHQRLLSSLKEMADEEQRLLRDHNHLQRQSSEKKKEMDELRKQYDHLQKWFTEEKQTLEHHVFTWIKNHPKLFFSNEIQQEISRSLHGLYDVNRYDEVREKLLAAVTDYEANLKADKTLTEKQKEEKEQEIESAKSDLHYWKTLKMPNPERTKGTEDFRTNLHEQKQAHLPFYAAVEFQDHVTDEQKERLESALKQTGLLDSLITSEAISPVHDRVLRAEPHVLGHTLADYLRPDVDENSAISAQLVDEILRSVPLEHGSAGLHIDLDGTYSIGCLVGHAPDEGPSKYIGRSSRKRYQQENIQACELELQRLQLELDELNGRLRNYQEELQQTDEWKRTIPTDQELRELYNQLERNEQLWKQQQDILTKLDEQWKLIHQQLMNIKAQLHQQGSHLNLTLTKEMIAQALEAAVSYNQNVYKLQNTTQQCVFARQRMKDYHARLQEKEEEMDEIKGDQNIKKSQLSQAKAEVESIEQQLKLKGIDEIRLRIQQVQQSLKEADENIEYIRETLPQKKEERKTRQQQLEEAQTSTAFWSNMMSEWEKIVKDEIACNFVDIKEAEPASIVLQLEDVTAKYDRSKLNEQLTKVFLNEQLHLTEYRMFEYTEEADRPEWFGEEWGDYYEPFLNEWQQLKGRKLIQMEYQGQRVSPYYVLSSLEKELEDQKGWLDERDRELYEDIIVNTVGVILRNRIQRAEKWVREMDKIMASRDNSSGLIFSIAWKPLTAESEQELDTKDLVGLLQRNSKFLNEEDLIRITKHFQSRIEKAKELIQLRNEGSTLHQVLKEVLDYRKWFTFVLSFRRVNEPKRELTNNAFFKFSGGEKAMAMYIPLFTAAYSRYKEAAEMAPYIISLDEAFAGVDENNIRDMFEVVEQLSFSYIMNSQALWGDYDTISSLSICELVRPKNADFVTVIRYQWDGKQRALVYDEQRAGEMVTNE
ncbi:uncharacterized protein (TIGR02680 family) [Bacillus fengqiuensis]|nr:uncharacterized protein (TIGR02680 family) [Bacillus fengqiuensis]